MARDDMVRAVALVANETPGVSSASVGRFLLLDRVDKPPQIDSAVLNRDREHHRTPRLCG